MKTAPITAVVLSLALGAATALAAVTVSNVRASQDAGSQYVDISYDLKNSAGGNCYVVVQVATNSGANANYVVNNSPQMDGDVGPNISHGPKKQVEWLACGFGELPGGKYVAHVRVVADADMVYILAGAFNMGTNNIPYDGQMTDAGPNHTVTISAFWMDKYEVTSQQWQDVYLWATNNGYAFDNSGSTKAPGHPVQTVNWYDCVKWCNARSQKENKTPCYYVDAGQTIIYKSGFNDVPNANVKWNADGYRLPTEAEWEKAARGGAVGQRFPWSDVDWISFDRANYYSYWKEVSKPYFPYDHATQPGNNPTFAIGDYPYTSPGGYFAANGYGLYDMAGNVWEWCWDWYDDNWYSNAGATQNDTSGPASSPWSYRVIRGCYWNHDADECRVAHRFYCTPGVTDYYLGFRCVRR